eukprot:CAMPEP_0114293988 /NCGR_PEP_ID=MMETSP0059-20121206/9884_1 /TAXON_ID=36894 /ORGANISM="Pyramimonas parkeae, Strain CCMP726" /LENGTH=627 /DNA_ID=CAMNT_0001415731 /DNA_START=16 /DNA_END=1900 /DNA_ORIENTATION=+
MASLFTHALAPTHIHDDLARASVTASTSARSVGMTTARAPPCSSRAAAASIQLGGMNMTKYTRSRPVAKLREGALNSKSWGLNRWTRRGITSPPTSGARRRVARMCGIIGIFKQEGGPGGTASELYEGLLMLQHRGQDSAEDGDDDGERFRERKDAGLVKDVFDKEAMDFLQGNIGIGHVRYPTAGGLSAQEAQPFFVSSPLGIYLIHNGNLTNTQDLREELTGYKDGKTFVRYLRTQSDSEVLLNVFADAIGRFHELQPNTDTVDTIFGACMTTMSKCQGAYSCITLINNVGMFAFRDPHGIRPLVLGRRPTVNGVEWCFASEDCAFGPIGFERVRDVKPGEAVLITEAGELVSRQCAVAELNPCIFEYIYLARPDSVLNDISVYEFQLSLGRKLAERIVSLGMDNDIDMVVPVPDGSRPAAIEMAAALNKPYREGLVKNRYVGRTFIMPDQKLRELSVRRKLNAMKTVFEGKRVLLVDDSIVRGTTMTQIVSMVRQAGAAKVYLASASPPVKFPNVYGVDMPSRKEFIAYNLTEEEVGEVLGADSLIYQSVEDLIQVGKEHNPKIASFDASCFDGTYVTGDIDEEYLAVLEATGRGKRAKKKGSDKSPAVKPLVDDSAEAEELSL